MHFTKYFTIMAFIATGVLASPMAGKPAPPKPAPPPPPPPPPPTTVAQSNQCGNGATPYCCNTDNLGQYTLCKALGASSVCSATTVCCNANNSIQVCLGNAIIEG